MKLLTFLALLLVHILPAALGQPVKTTTPHDPTTLTVLSATYSGTGCPAGSGGTSIDFSDPERFGLTLDDFNLYIGPDISPVDKSRSCTINLRLSVPPGYGSYPLTQISTGFLSLSPGVAAKFYTTVFWSGDVSAVAQPSTSFDNLEGEEDIETTFVKETNLSVIDFMPLMNCDSEEGKEVIVNFGYRVALLATNATGLGHVNVKSLVSGMELLPCP